MRNRRNDTTKPSPLDPADKPRDDKVHAFIVAPACGLGLLGREHAMAKLKNMCIAARSLYDKDSCSLVL